MYTLQGYALIHFVSRLGNDLDLKVSLLGEKEKSKRREALLEMHLWEIVFVFNRKS